MQYHHFVTLFGRFEGCKSNNDGSQHGENSIYKNYKIPYRQSENRENGQICVVFRFFIILGPFRKPYGLEYVTVSIQID